MNGNWWAVLEMPMHSKTVEVRKQLNMSSLCDAVVNRANSFGACIKTEHQILT